MNNDQAKSKLDPLYKTLDNLQDEFYQLSDLIEENQNSLDLSYFEGSEIQGLITRVADDISDMLDKIDKAKNILDED